MKRFEILLLLSTLTVMLLATGVSSQATNSQDFDRLVNTLNDDSWQIRWQAVTELGDLKDPRAIEPLAKALREDENSYVRATAAWALGEIKDSRAIEPLIAALSDESHGVKKNAALALKTITGEDFGKDPKLWQQWWEKKK